MNRRSFLRTIGLATASIGFGGCTKSADSQVNVKTRKPNVVIFFCDDLGYSDVGYHGCDDFHTPNIDSIAKNGARFSAAYVTAPICGPSRAGLLTGRYQQRFGFEDNPAPWAFCQSPDTQIGIPPEEKTMGERMRELGYKTAFIGKHHSGQKPDNNPVNRGFDFFFGFDNGASEYFFHEYKQKTPERLRRGLETVRNEPDYYTDAFGREAVAFIEQNQNKPFLLYVPFNAPHGPMQAPEELIRKYSHITHQERQKLAAMMDAVDTNIGRVLRKIRELKLEENTIVIFTSDNGGDQERSNFSYNLPLRDKKGTFYEGGIRVPFCMQWKGTISAGQVFDFPIITLDIMPTVISASGNNIQKSWRLDGIDLLPYLTRQISQPDKRYLYWRHLYGWAIRNDRWKLIRPGKNKPIELYDLANDIGEKNNIIEQYPDIAERLQEAWNNWSGTLIKPQWGTAKELCGSHPIPTTK